MPDQPWPRPSRMFLIIVAFELTIIAVMLGIYLAAVL